MTSVVGDSQPVTSESDLERTVGLFGAVTVGVGTMIGAGIFVFPGLAAGRAGPAAAVSFALGAVIALLVALPTAELATAMPKSGGGYYLDTAREGAETDDTAQTLSAVVTALEEAGVERRRVTTTIERADEPLDALADAADEHDLLVIGEDEPTLAGRRSKCKTS